MDAALVAQLATRFTQLFGWDDSDTGPTEPTLTEFEDGSRAIVLPRDQMWEPYRSFRLIEAAAVGTTLVITFHWGDGDEMVFLLPIDVRPFVFEDNIDVDSFLHRHLESTLGEAREDWEAARSTPISPGLTVVRSNWAQ
jgi:hypothetical protein